MIELEGVRFHTPNGPGDAEAGFAPFGSPPQLGSMLEIDHPALRVPGIERVRLGIEWAGLPPAGFAHHYAGYVPLYTVRNDSFRVTMRAPGLGWEAEGRQMPLFQGSADGPVEPISWFDLRAVKSRAVAPNENPIELTLAAPGEALGNMVYSAALMAAPMKLAATAKPAGGLIGWMRRLFGHRPAPPAIPNAPWLPIAAKVHVSVWPA